MSGDTSAYELYYWPFLPGRGEFVRLVLETAGATYRDVAREASDPDDAVRIILDVRAGSLGGLRPYAPPVLRHGELVLAQTAVICSYLGERHGLVGESQAARLHARQIQNTVCDVVDEAHDTHHPLSGALTFEDQRDAAIRSAQCFVTHRLPGHLHYFEAVLASSGGPFLFGARLSYVDLSLFQLLCGLEYAFPRAMAALSPDAERLHGLRGAVAGDSRLSGYLQSDRRMPFNEHCVFRRYPELDLLP